MSLSRLLTQPSVVHHTRPEGFGPVASPLPLAHATIFGQVALPHTISRRVPPGRHRQWLTSTYLLISL